MIPLSELNAMTERYNVPIDTVEKDYVISWILTCVANSNIAKDFIFYGGTAIKRVYFEDHRFSEDIDFFSTKYFSKDQIISELVVLNQALEMVNIQLTINQDDIIQKEDRIELYIDYTGFDEISGSQKRVKVDFMMRMDLLGDVQNKHIIKSYSDINDGKNRLNVLSLNTILAYKIALLNDNTRKEPRDIYDIWFLLCEKIDQFDFDLEKICTIVKQKYGWTPNLSMIKSSLDNKAFRIKWDQRLSKQIANLQEYDSVVKKILNQWKWLEKNK